MIDFNNKGFLNSSKTTNTPNGKVKFEFTGKTAIVEVSKVISKHLLT